MNPFIFHQIRAHYRGQPFKAEWESMQQFFSIFLAHIPKDLPEKGKINKLKQLLSFLFKGSQELLERRQMMLTCLLREFDAFVAHAFSLFKEGWEASVFSNNGANDSSIDS